jgi:hypothetical protein
VALGRARRLVGQKTRDRDSVGVCLPVDTGTFDISIRQGPSPSLKCI